MENRLNTLPDEPGLLFKDGREGLLLRVRTHKGGLQTIPRINQLKVTETASSQDKRFGAEMQLTISVRRLEDSITSSLEKQGRTHSVYKCKE